jgi:hypothetical protein
MNISRHKLEVSHRKYIVHRVLWWSKIWAHSARRLLVSILHQPPMTVKHVAFGGMRIVRSIELHGEKLPQRHFVHHKLHLVEPWPPPLEAGDWTSESWHNLSKLVAFEAQSTILVGKFALELLMALNTESKIFWDVTPCSLLDQIPTFRKSQLLPFSGFTYPAVVCIRLPVHSPENPNIYCYIRRPKFNLRIIPENWLWGCNHLRVTIYSQIIVSLNSCFIPLNITTNKFIWILQFSESYFEVNLCLLLVMLFSPFFYYCSPLACSWMSSVRFLPVMSETKFYTHVEPQAKLSF